MRRFIDSLILVLVAYTLIVPLVRGLTPSAEPAQISSTPPSHWCIVGENVAGAELQVRLDSGDGASQDFAVICDEYGCFKLPFDAAPPPPAKLAVFDQAGSTLTQVEVSGDDNSAVFDLGALR